MITTILRTRYGRQADSYERVAELGLSVAVFLTMAASLSILFSIVSSLATSIITIQTLNSSWNSWADPPIKAPQKLLYRDFFITSLICGPFLISALYAMIKCEPWLLIPALISVISCILIYPLIPAKISKKSHTFHPFSSGKFAYVEFKLRRSKLPVDGITYAIVHAACGITLFPHLPLLPWLCLGFSFGLTISLLYRGRDDLPGHYIREMVKFPEYTAYIYPLIPAWVFLLVGSLWIRSVAFIIAYIIVMISAILIGGKIDIYPAIRARQKFMKFQTKPTLLMDTLAQLFLVGLWCGIVFFGLI